MVRAKVYGSGWHKESLRHSRAKKLGKAGGTYAQRLSQGAKVEAEHASTIAKIKKNPTITTLQAEELIAKDHLREDPLYYNKLKTIEAKPKNTALKMRSIDNPYEIWKSPDGNFETRILKKWQQDDNKPYARWYTATKSPATFGSWEYGDMYVKDIKQSMKKVN